MIYIHYKYWNYSCNATEWRESSVLLSEDNTISSILDLLAKSHACTYKLEERAEVIILNMIWDKKEIKI